MIIIAKTASVAGSYIARNMDKLPQSVHIVTTLDKIRGFKDCKAICISTPATGAMWCSEILDYCRSHNIEVEEIIL